MSLRFWKKGGEGGEKRQRQEKSKYLLQLLGLMDWIHIHGIVKIHHFELVNVDQSIIGVKTASRVIYCAKVTCWEQPVKRFSLFDVSAEI